MHGGRMTPVGVTDAVMHRNGISFMRFEYPSVLPAAPQQAMAEIAARLMPALGFDGSLFNIEFFVRDDGSVSDRRGERAHGIAVRAAGAGGARRVQLRAGVGAGRGRVAVAAPARPGVVAASFLLRYYEDAIVRSLPDPLPFRRRFPAPRSSCSCARASGCRENDDDVRHTGWP